MEIKLYKMRTKLWIHYIMLTAILFAAFYVGENFIHLSQLNTWQMALYWFAVLVTGDRLIHKYYLKEE